MTGREKLARLKSGHIPLVQALFDEAYACGHKDGRADAEEVATMLEVVPESARRWSAIRAAVATVQAATGLGGATPLDDDAVAELLASALQNAARAHYAETALRVDAEANARTLERHRRLFVGQQARAERAESELAAAQAELTAARRGPVVEWRTRIDVEEATVGAFALLVESDGWRLEVSDGTGDYWIVDSGPETGPAGKSAAEAAYLKAAGL